MTTKPISQILSDAADLIAPEVLEPQVNLKWTQDKRGSFAIVPGLPFEWMPRTLPMMGTYDGRFEAYLGGERIKQLLPSEEVARANAEIELLRRLKAIVEMLEPEVVAMLRKAAEKAKGEESKL